ncbi:MAG: hypothetical protein JO057_28465 [Chloroflexi bacterium]|nr:hypothetical protein [Chloroflexota bacterium]
MGASTYIGRVETPRVGQIVNTGNGVLVSGWVADTTAQGWAGIDGVQVWMGDMANGGTKLATGSVGLSRPDIADSIGANFTNSGFSGVVPSSVLSTLPAGNVDLRLYIHTPSKGWWYRQSHVTAVQPPVLPYPNDPIVTIAKPQNGMNFTQRQIANRAVFSGMALDRNPLSSVANSLSLLPPGVGQSLALNGCPGCLGATNYIYTQFRGPGVSTLSAYIDAPAKSGDLSAPGYFGGTTQSAAPLQGVVILANNAGFLNRSGKPQGSIVQDQYGPDFRFGGWVLTLNLATISPGSHTLYVTAYSSVTGKSNTASAQFNVLPYTGPSQKIQP